MRMPNTKIIYLSLTENDLETLLHVSTFHDGFCPFCDGSINSGWNRAIYPECDHEDDCPSKSLWLALQELRRT